MKKLLVIIFFLCGIAAKSQIYLPSTVTQYGENVNRLKPLQVLHLPSYTGDLTLHTTDESPQIRINDGALQWWYDGAWHNASEGGGGGTVCNSLDETAVGDGATMDFTYAFADETFIYNYMPNLASVTWSAGYVTFHFSLAPTSSDNLHFVVSSIGCTLTGGGGSPSVTTMQNAYDNSVTASELNPMINTSSDGIYIRGVDVVNRFGSQNSLDGTLAGVGTDGLNKNAYLFAGTTSLKVYTGHLYTSLSSGAGYVLTDVLGDGNLTMQAPPSGGGGSYDYTNHPITYVSNPDLDASTGNFFNITLAGNAIMTFSNFEVNHIYYLTIKQNSTGGYRLTLPSTAIAEVGAFYTGKTLANTSTAFGRDEIEIRYDGTNYIIKFFKNLK